MPDIDQQDLLDAIEDSPGAVLRKNRKQVEDEMDITPMIDITFLLLIFFLVASTPDKQTSIELPAAKTGSPVSQLTSVVFTLGDGGLDTAPLFLADGKIEEARMSDDKDNRKAEIKAAIEEGLSDTKTDAIIKADKSVKSREVGNVIKGISQVDGIKIHLAILEVQ